MTAKQVYELRDSEDQDAYEAAAKQFGGYVYRVPERNLNALRNEIEKINKRARKINVPEVELVLTGEQDVIEWETPSGLNGKMVKQSRTYEFITIKGETPVVAGFEFAATLQHEDGDVIVRRMPFFNADVDLSAYYHADPSNCDHCGLDRRRKDTFVVYNAETGETKQVGRQCIKDFLGFNDPERVAKFAEYLRDRLDSFGSDDYDDEDGWSGPRGEQGWETDWFLANVEQMIRNHGWISKGSAGWDQEPTSSEAFYNMVNYGEYGKYDRKPLFEEVEQDSIDFAKPVLEWARGEFTKDGNEFEHNMAVALKSDYVTRRTKGLVAYAVQAYRKHLSIEAEKKAAANDLNEHVGTVGQRQTFESLTVTDERYIEGNYGTTTLYTLKDTEGRTYKWFASNDILTVGDTYNLTATIKKHDEFRGVNQTVLTRAKVS